MVFENGRFQNETSDLEMGDSSDSLDEKNTGDDAMQNSETKNWHFQIQSLIFNPTVLEAYLEFEARTGTAAKLSISSFT